MLPVTYRDDEQVIDRLDEIAEEHDVGRAAVLREAVREYLADYEGDAPSAYDSDAPAITARVRELEERLDDLEQRVEATESRPESHTEAPRDAPTDSPAGAAPESEPDAPGDSSAADEGLDELARSVLDERSERYEQDHAAVVAALGYLRQHGDARRSHIIDDVEPEHSITGRKPETWWETTVRPALRELASADTPVRLSGRTYEWADL